jgi:hypothetical protein
VPINLDNLLHGTSFKEGRGNALFYAKYYAFRCGDLQNGLGGAREGVSWKLTPIAVEPSLMASREYSTWKRRPSGENVLAMVTESSYHVN